MSNEFRDVDPHRAAQERQDFLNGSAPVEVAGLVESGDDSSVWAGLLVVGDAAFRVWPELASLMALVSTGQGEEVSRSAGSRTRWAVLDGAEPLIRLDVTLEEPALSFRLAVLAEPFKEHLWRLEAGGIIAITTAAVLEPPPEDLLPLVRRSLAVEVEPSPGLATLLDRHGWPRAGDGPVEVQLGRVTWPIQAVAYTGRDTLTMLGDTFDATGDCCVCTAALGDPPWHAMVDLTRDTTSRRTRLNVGVAHHGCARARPAWLDANVTILAAQDTYMISLAVIAAPPQDEGSEGTSRRSWWRRHPRPASALRYAAVIISPTVDRVVLDVDSDGDVHDKVMQDFLVAGWQQLSPEVLAGRAVATGAGFTARLHDGGVTINSPGGGPWTTEVPSPWADLAEVGGVLVILTRYPNGTTLEGLTVRQFHQLFADAAARELPVRPGPLYAVMPLS